MQLLSTLRRSPAGNIIIVFAVAQVACVVFGLLFPQSFPYLQTRSIGALLVAVSPLTIMAAGVGVLMISGEFDLSVGSTFALAPYVMALLVNNWGLPAPAAIVAALAVGAGIGAINGVITLKARIPSFIATLGAMMFWRGILLALSQGASQSFRPGGWTKALFTGSVGPLQAQFGWALLVVAAAYVLMHYHRLGNHIFAVGGNLQSAVAIGVKPYRVKLFCFVLVGLLAAFAGVIDAVESSSISPKQGQTMELRAIAACVVGGLSLTGGVGSMLGVLFGTALLFTIQTVLFLLRAPGEYLDAFVGLLIVVAVVFNRVTRKE